MKNRFKKPVATFVIAASLFSVTPMVAPLANAQTAVSTTCCREFEGYPVDASIQALQGHFSDVSSSTNDYSQAILWAYQKGIIQGYGNNTFGPDDCVTRAELVKMIVQYVENNPAYSTIGSSFSDPYLTDVHTSDWFYNYVKEAKARGYIMGYPDGSFRPNQCVNRAEAMKIADRSLIPTETLDSSGSPITYGGAVLITDVPIDSWFAPYARALFKYRLVGTNHTQRDPAAAAMGGIKFFPEDPMTRKEVAEMLYRISLSLLKPLTTPQVPTPISTIHSFPPANIALPVLQSPASGTNVSIASTNIFFQFYPSNAGSYQVGIMTPGNSTYQWYGYAALTSGFPGAPASNGTYAVDINKSLINTNGTYYWKVRAWSGANGTGSYIDTNPWTFYVTENSSNNGSLGAAVLYLPSNNQVYPSSSNLPVNFTWSNVSGASYYYLMVRVPQSSTYFVNQQTYNNSSSYSFSATNQGYYWKVRTYSGGSWTDSPENYLSFGS